ncbi:MAG: ZIP family metal transporter [Flavobacteriales bacterium]|jgi:zinc transporter ZupT|nr:ZIP family metal transporter [Flavobacteriales bacterium]|tara:strand:+ start:4259 stop:4960 length:702 start_codon:yes stop_codon:yes gene_type:complete
MTITDYIILLSSVFVGALIAFYIKNISQNNTKLLISFSGAYLFSITVLHLIPETFAGQHNHIIGLFILIGFFIQIILEHFSKGVEHGHGHVHGSIPISILIGLSIHSFIEGMPLGNPHHHSHMHSSLLSAIALHKIPVGIVLTHMLIESKMSKLKIILLISAFAITTPLGTLFSQYISNISNYYSEIMAIVIGMFLHISTTILFESSEGHHFNSRKAIAIFLGTSIALISTFL